MFLISRTQAQAQAQDQPQTGIGQASNFNISADEALKYGCGEKCQEVLAYTNAGDLQTMGTAFDFEFYATAKNFSSSSTPGDLLKLAPINSTQLTVPDGMTTFRFQYVSKNVDGRSVPATGFIAFPFLKPDSGKYPLVAFAHGTIGVFPGCGPSSSPTLFNYNSWGPLMYRGYAIVATDYAGLGNNHTTLRYLSYVDHANDVYYSVQAARKAFPGAFTEEWMSIGHSQGASAVWKLSEHPLVQSSTSGYLGTVAVAPAPKLYDTAVAVYEQIIPRPDYHQYVFTAEMGHVLYGVMQAFPNYTAPWCGEGLRKRIGLATLGQMCTLAFGGLSLDLPRDQLYLPGVSVKDDETLKEFQRIHAPAQGDLASRPMLVIHGMNDTSCLIEITEEAVRDAVSAGNEIEFLRYPGLDHSATLTASSPVWLKYIDETFARTRRYSNSTIKTVEPFNLAVAKKSLEAPMLDEQPWLGIFPTS
ncbi:prolyl aminopeptidase (secreted) protein [Rutstroemia sp. NJR-2017a BBW]|nr:prolyl aminopeptidase (secreted) protein [Rutstroemia sp. NJR-2017a BBW]